MHYATLEALPDFQLCYRNRCRTHSSSGDSANGFVDRSVRLRRTKTETARPNWR